MKNEFFKNKGFYIALYLFLGILIVLGIGVGVRNFLGDNDKKVSDNNVTESVLEDIEVEGVLTQQADNYEDKLKEQLEARISDYVDPHEYSDILAETSENFSKEQVTDFSETEISEEDIAPSVTFVEENNDDAKDEYVSLENPTPKEETSPVNNTSDEAVAEVEEETFTSFVDGNKMSWPLIGEILMDYSTDHVVYDRTLDLYRTNDSIWISSDVGEQVKATADGVVIKVEKSNEYGNTVIVDNGNGWTTTYGQLQDNILVSSGDVVKTGQVIGGVNKPSKNASLENPHLLLQICKNTETIDPKLLLAQ